MRYPIYTTTEDLAKGFVDFEVYDKTNLCSDCEIKKKRFSVILIILIVKTYIILE